MRNARYIKNEQKIDTWYTFGSSKTLTYGKVTTSKSFNSIIDKLFCVLTFLYNIMRATLVLTIKMKLNHTMMNRKKKTP